MKYLAAEAAYARELAANTRELLALSREWTRSESRAERAAFFAELAAAGRINLAPKQGQNPQELYTVDEQGVAHINIVGQLTPVAEQDVCGGYTANALTEYGYIQAATQAAGADPRVRSIDYHVNSPGGYVQGVDETAQAMAAAPVPTRAMVSDMAASAAYWLASQTDQIIAQGPGTRVGSIGVITEEFNADRALSAAGIDHNVYTSTDAPMKHADTSTPEGKAQVVAELDQLHAVFASRVAEGRGVSLEKVNKDFGQGGLKTAADAMASGMIDGIQGASIGRRAMQNDNGGVAASAERPIKPKGKIMTLEQLKAENPDVFAQVFALGRTDGIKAEQDRVRELSAWKDGHNADTVKVAEEAIVQGKTYAEVASQLAAASARGPKQLDGDNPPAVGTAALKNAAGTSDSDLTEEDKAAANLIGMSLEDYRKYKDKE